MPILSIHRGRKRQSSDLLRVWFLHSYSSTHSFPLRLPVRHALSPLPHTASIITTYVSSFATLTMKKTQAVVVSVRCFRCGCLIEAMSTDELPVVEVSTNLFYCLSCDYTTGYSKEVLGKQKASRKIKDSSSSRGA